MFSAWHYATFLLCVTHPTVADISRNPDWLTAHRDHFFHPRFSDQQFSLRCRLGTGLSFVSSDHSFEDACWNGSREPLTRKSLTRYLCHCWKGNQKATKTSCASFLYTLPMVVLFLCHLIIFLSTNIHGRPFSLCLVFFARYVNNRVDCALTILQICLARMNTLRFLVTQWRSIR